MGARGSGRKTHRLEIACPVCGSDEWRERSDGRFICAVCDRRTSRERNRSKRTDLAVSLWENAKQRAGLRLLSFSITIEDVRAAIPTNMVCPALGIALKRGEGFSHAGSPTLDRLNDEWGYEPGNIAVISHKANAMKGRATAAELEQVAAWMRSRGLD
jgi:hypothetical protein